MATKLSELMSKANVHDLRTEENTEQIDTPQEEQQEQESSVVTPGVFISYLMNTRNVLHMLHLLTKVYEVHISLDELYKGIVEHIDSIVEEKQGYTQELITGYSDFSLKEHENTDPVAFVKSCLDYVETNRKVLGEESYIQNKIDELVGFLSSGLYKLTFLK